ncbi:1,4-dihydroxy-2-naphthoate polyprenyltransferase [Pasteurella bettyae]|uniref:1,4-dihydroxy-2-naphthoate octaprenyltransferase n=1 Tax=Pasteurella bettyae CCUG 2042 TaxID=1095749 RepID=I3DJJ2_9PAST|nr:1,4-dihydroxy-2-naphthoate polyprenyltransferase [Pasteurella bettyae]EIJ71885.1 1,4-dihydroxy-2-naphthoate octaprenyltransferase [Pasteurella bettyae CCUG 2042]SUB22341.1 1,4-dihydroxy-2-naphthoate octaprenyltransferase [Pasteurella bettyae]
MTQSTIKTWLETARPRTLPLALAIIFTGSAVAYWFGYFDWTITILCLLTATLLQILSNFANDYGDFQKGSDTAERIGPLRGIQKGHMTEAQLRKGLIVTIVLILISGFALLSTAYQSMQDLIVFIALGIASIVAAIAYTVGKKPYGYLGLGDLFVFLFFGLLAVVGTYYLQAHNINWTVFLPASGCGFLSVAVLNINNMRDIEQDRKAGKYTLVVRLGVDKSRVYHWMLLISGILCYLLFSSINVNSIWGYLFIFAIPLLVKHGLFVYRSKDPLLLRPMLGQMSLLALLTNVLFSIGLVLAK